MQSIDIDYLIVLVVAIQHQGIVDNVTESLLTVE